MPNEVEMIKEATAEVAEATEAVKEVKNITVSDGAKVGIGAAIGAGVTIGIQKLAKGFKAKKAAKKPKEKTKVDQICEEIENSLKG